MVVVEHCVPYRMVTPGSSVERYRKGTGYLRVNDVHRTMDVGDQMDNEFDVESHRILRMGKAVFETVDRLHNGVHGIEFRTFRRREGFVVGIYHYRMFIGDMFVLLIHPSCVIDDRSTIEILFDGCFRRRGEDIVRQYRRSLRVPYGSMRRPTVRYSMRCIQEEIISFSSASECVRFCQSNKSFSMRARRYPAFSICRSANGCTFSMKSCDCAFVRLSPDLIQS